MGFSVFALIRRSLPRFSETSLSSELHHCLESLGERNRIGQGDTRQVSARNKCNVRGFA